ncbi:hypothetical protein [Streptomyces sp. NPDC001604]
MTGGPVLRAAGDVDPTGDVAEGEHDEVHDGGRAGLSGIEFGPCT